MLNKEVDVPKKVDSNDIGPWPNSAIQKFPIRANHGKRQEENESGESIGQKTGDFAHLCSTRKKKTLAAA